MLCGFQVRTKQPFKEKCFYFEKFISAGTLIISLELEYSGQPGQGISPVQCRLSVYCCLALTNERLYGLDSKHAEPQRIVGTTGNYISSENVIIIYEVPAVV